MSIRIVSALATAATVLLLAGCATPSTEDAAPAEAGSERAATTETKESAPRATVTATETAALERRSPAASTREGGSGTSAEMAKLVDQLNEAARELATLRTANAKLRAERSRPAAEPAAVSAPAAAPAPKSDPVEEKLAASLKSYAQFRQEMTTLVAEVERLKKANLELSAETKTLADQARQSKASTTEVDRLKKSSADLAAEVRLLTEQARQAKSAQVRLEEDLRAEKRLRLEAEGNAGQLREQLRTIARAMSDVGVSAGKSTGATDSAGARSRTATKYVVREGDSLLKIAERVYGDADKWRVIMEANRGRVGTDGALEVGTELQIPRN